MRAGELQIINVNSSTSGMYFCGGTYNVSKIIKPITRKSMPIYVWNGSLAVKFNVYNNRKNRSYSVNCSAKVSANDYYIKLFKDNKLFYTYNKYRKKILFII